MIEWSSQTDNPFESLGYPQLCDLVERDVKARLEDDYRAVVKIDEIRDGEEYAVAFAFSCEEDEVVMSPPPYVGNDIILKPYTPSFSLKQRREMS